uniref:Uncharacterized protein n=1 Tax=Siphoviridae sp. ctD2Q91 TaxID=2825383 RepID=A0A8S5PPX4_9CAUD|nr:MAG TPA: hypothetical protein [Siphoviridae sp. ctD2Q91]
MILSKLQIDTQSKRKRTGERGRVERPSGSGGDHPSDSPGRETARVPNHLPRTGRSVFNS